MSRYFRIILFFLMLFPLTAMAEEHLQITEVMASNGTWTSGHAYDWVEIYNAGSSRVELSGWHLSDSKKHPDKFEFPEGASIGSGEYILVYCTGSETENSAKDPYYAPFKISASKDQVYLFSPDSAIHDSISFEDQYGNISYGISTSGETGYFETATPGKKNGSTVFQRRPPALYHGRQHALRLLAAVSGRRFQREENHRAPDPRIRRQCRAQRNRQPHMLRRRRPAGSRGFPDHG